MGGLSRERDNQRRGKGIEVGPDGAHYEDDYEHGRRAGRGHFDWADGSCYDGQFAENDIHGKGAFK